ncbi:hypothetical protein D3C76_19980 [compost metagenome]
MLIFSAVMLFLLLYTFFSFLLIKSLRKVNYFVKVLKKRDVFESPVGNIYKFINIPENMKGKPFIAIISSPTCSHCYPALEELVMTRTNLNQYLCFLVVENQSESVSKFYFQFGEKIRILEISMDIVNTLRIDSAPLYILVDQNGIIVTRKITLQAITREWESLQKTNYFYSGSFKGEKNELENFTVE